jgi:sugar phosphate permease
LKIINEILNIFQPAKHKPKIEDKELVKKQYKYWRIRIIYSLYIGYVFFYFSRKSFTFLMPNIKSDLDLTNAELGFFRQYTIYYIWH